MLAIAMPAAAVLATEFKSPADALQQGLSAYRGGYYEMAIPALERAVESKLFMAQYTLARIYADNRTPFTDHAKAYVLFQRLADEHADVDPEDDQRAQFVAKSLVALAGYLRRGLPELGVRRDPERAAEYLQHAAIFLDDEDAQFELAKIMLEGDGTMKNVPTAKHMLSTVSQKGHAPAQAFLADLYWRGQYVEKDPIKAFALISVAVRNAPASDRVWIEDIYQTIYCGAAEGTRRQATGMVAEWSQRYGRAPEAQGEPDFDNQSLSYVRLCANGEAIPLDRSEAASVETQAAVGDPKPAERRTNVNGEGRLFLRGNASGGIRDTGISLPQAPGR